MKTFLIFFFFVRLFCNKRQSHITHDGTEKSNMKKGKKNNGRLCSTKRTATQNKFSMVMFLVFVPFDTYKVNWLYVHLKVDVSTSNNKRHEAMSHEP